MAHREREIDHRREIENFATAEIVARANREQWNQDSRRPRQHRVLRVRFSDFDSRVEPINARVSNRRRFVLEQLDAGRRSISGAIRVQRIEH